jgi:hypothetical protein
MGGGSTVFCPFWISYHWNSITNERDPADKTILYQILRQKVSSDLPPLLFLFTNFIDGFMATEIVSSKRYNKIAK